MLLTRLLPVSLVAVAEQVEDLAVGADPIHHRSVLADRGDGLV